MYGERYEKYQNRYDDHGRGYGGFERIIPKFNPTEYRNLEGKENGKNKITPPPPHHHLPSLTSTRNRKSPKMVENAQASSMKLFILSWGDSVTKDDTCNLLTASMFGNRYVLIISAKMCTDTNIVVQTANNTNNHSGTSVGEFICNSTIAT